MSPKSAIRNAAEPVSSNTGQDKSALLRDAAPEMLAQLKKVVRWLDKLGANSEAEEKKYRGRWDSLADNARADAKNWRATAANLRATVVRADPKWT